MVNHPAADMTVRPAAAADIDSVARIYNYFIDETTVTFEEAPVSAGEIARRIREVEEASLPWLVAQEGDRVVGYAYAAKWKGRSGYRFSTEVTIYLDHGCVGRGIGSLLYGRLLSRLETRGVHVAIGGIALPNDDSVALHEKFGFAKVAHFREVGFKFGRWLDVGYWQKTLAAPTCARPPSVIDDECRVT
jgi:phosphinothricin acetyltransferase